MRVAASAQVSPGPPDVDVVVVPMRRRHLRAVLRIEARVCPRPWTLALFLSELAAGPDRHYLVARAGGVVVGYAGMITGADEGHVTTLAVDPAWHRRKVASRLLLGLVQWGVDQGCAGLTLEVRMGNVAAQALYRQFGFVPAGVRRGYYVETDEDALIMWAHDAGTPAYAGRLAAIAALLPVATAVGATT
jgi:ribosomal-protein-alanine N-acetyltransferase